MRVAVWHMPTWDRVDKLALFWPVRWAGCALADVLAYKPWRVCGHQARGLTMRVFEHLFARIKELQEARCSLLRMCMSSAYLPNACSAKSHTKMQFWLPKHVR